MLKRSMLKMSGQSEVYSATKNTLFSKNSDPKWVYGRTPSLPVLALQDHDQQVVLYAAANVGVIYNHTSNSQHILQGHSQNLSSVCVSDDRRWIATADPSPMAIVWDSYSGYNVITLSPHSLSLPPLFHLFLFSLCPLSPSPVSSSSFSSLPPLSLSPVSSSSLSFLSLLSLPPTSLPPLSPLPHSLQGGAVDLRFPTSCYSICAADGALVQTAFHWREPQVLTATAGGSVVVWDLSKGMTTTKGLTNVTAIHLQQAPFTAMSVTDRILELYLKHLNSPFYRNFIVSSTGSSVLHVNSESAEAQSVLQEEPEPIHALCCHPSLPLLVTGSSGGMLKLRDMCSRRTVTQREFKQEEGLTCVTYDPSGKLLAVGFSSGSVDLLDSSSLRTNPEQEFHLSKDSINLLSFSDDSLYLAAADSGFAVSVLRRVSAGAPWEILGRHRSHYSPIQSLLFGLQLDSTLPRLLSLGLDRRLVEYDLELHSGLPVLSCQRVEQRAVPLGMTWYPPLSTEQFLLICSDQYKLRLINSTTHMCRRVVHGPVYGSPLQRVLSRSSHLSIPILYVCQVGLQVLPADGNPFKSQALVCHPSGVQTLSASFDGTHVVTSGGADFTARSWTLDAAAALGGSGMEPFYSMLDGGRDGTFYKEVEDLFYYLQLRHQGIDTEHRRHVSTTIPLNHVSTMMRAIGFFPTEQEIEDLQNEVKFSRYAETGQYVMELCLEDFIKLYVNHRPAFGLVKEELQENLNCVSKACCVPGEAMTEDEVLQSFSSLLDLNKDQDSPRSSSKTLVISVLVEASLLRSYLPLLCLPVSMVLPTATEITQCC
uniref:Cilia- and flagella-associated protein 251 n=1 Tax=Periophthalmus magnuspinnatus TaxID=409849 RepID=A0A3B3ZGB4_9GOBI